MTPSLRWLVATSLLAVGVLPRPTTAACVDYPEFLHREGGVALPGTAEEVAVQGDYAYVAAAFGDLAVVDISDPDAPRLVTRVILPDEKHGAHDVVVSGHYAYVAAVNAGLQVIDIAQPTQPVIVGWTPTIDAALGVDVRGNYAYVAARKAGLVIVDITDPTSPAIAGSVLTLDFALKVKVVGTRA